MHTYIYARVNVHLYVYVYAYVYVYVRRWVHVVIVNFVMYTLVLMLK